MKKSLSLLLLLAATTTVNAQYFQRLYGTTGDEFLTDGHNSTVGNYANYGAFFVAPSPVNSYIFTATKTNWRGQCPAGGTFFNNEYQLNDALTILAPTLKIQEVHSVENSALQTFATAGSYINGQVPAGGYQGVFYAELNADGTMSPNIKRYTIPGLTSTYGNLHVQKIITSLQNQNEYYICGYMTENNTGNNRVFVIKIDNTGTMIWNCMYPMVNIAGTSETPYDIVESSYPNSNGIFEVIVVGKRTLPTIGGGLNDDAFLLRINSTNGNPINNVQFYGTVLSNESFTCIKSSYNPNVASNQHGYVIGGNINDSRGNTKTDFWFVAVDQTGTVSWTKKYNYNGGTGANEDHCNDIIEHYDLINRVYEYYLAGYTDNGAFGSEDIFVIKTDDWGNGVGNGQFTYGTAGDQRCIRIDYTDNNADGLSLFGYTYRTPQPSPPLGGFDNWLIKAHFDGTAPCDYDLMDPGSATGPGYRNSIAIDPFIDVFYESTMYGKLVGAAHNETICEDCEDIAPTPIAHWNFTSGSLVDDINGLTGTIVGGVTPTLNAMGTGFDAYYFDGTSGYIQVPSNALLDLGDPTHYNKSWTITALVRPDGFYSNWCQGNAIVWRGTEYSTTHYKMEIFDNGYDNDCQTYSPSYEVFAGAPAGIAGWPQTDWTAPTPCVSNPCVSTGTWYCVWLSYDALNEQLDLYVDGNHVFSHHWSNQYTSWGIEDLFIGSCGNMAHPYFFKGAIDDIALYEGSIRCPLSCVDQIIGLPKTTSVANATKASSNISIYPNPADNSLHINGISEANYDIIAIDGRIVLSGKVKSINAIDITSLTPGVYVIKILENGTTQNLKFTKQ
ncbi:MAG: T9SS type A sorting domain-containing protein [Bacteroidetes bacterium]|nr:T9SS type A sorting domain-containing protein [Bacteroidota bacterium]